VTILPRRLAGLASSRLVWTTVLCLALVLGTAVRLQSMSTKRSLRNDESVTYLAAAGNLGAFAAAGTGTLSGRWEPVQRWQSYLSTDGFWGFDRIRLDLNHLDSHPPLYFWLLHVWMWAIGLHIWVGPLLNTLIALATGVVLFLAARRFLASALEASLVTLLWTISAPVLATSMMARQYELLALFGVLLALFACRLAERGRQPGWADAAGFAAATAGGLLTHYEFAPFALGTAAVVAIIVFRERRRLWLTLSGLVGGLLVSIVVNPGFYHSFVRQRGQAGQFTLWAFAGRVGATLSSLGSFFGITHATSVVVTPAGTRLGRVCVIAAAVVIVLSAAGLVLSPRARRKTRAWLAGLAPTNWLFVALVLLAAACTIGLYVTLQVPEFAMGTHYLALFWPFLAMVVMYFARSLRRVKLPAMAAVALLVAVPVSVHAFTISPRASASFVPLAPGHSLVVDSLANGILPRALWYFPGATPVLADSQKALLNNADQWIASLQPGDLFVHVNSATVSRGLLGQTLARLRRLYVVKPLPSGSLAVGSGYRIESRRQSGP
jgi:hypothetical protein